LIKKLFFIFLIVFSFSQKLLQGQTTKIEVPVKTRILFIFDASNSMYAQWSSGSKFDVSKKLLSRMVDSLDKLPNLEMALRVFGHTNFVRSKTDRNCQDTKLEVPFSELNAYKIKKKLKEIQPRGTTLLAYSLQETINDFKPCKNCRNIVILLTDGIEECDGDPCAVSYTMQKNNIILKPFIIGLGMGPEVDDAFRCIGTYYNTTNEQSLSNIMNLAVSQALNNTTVQINLLDINDKPIETNVNMTLYDNYSGAIRYNYVHTMNEKGFPDTVPIDPLGKYDLVVHTTPIVKKDSIQIVPGKHNIIEVKTPQGTLELKMNTLSEYKELRAVIKKKGENKTINVQNFNTNHKYLVGKYDIEILTLPRMNIDIEIKQSENSKIEIPNPGLFLYRPGMPLIASLYVLGKNELKWIYNLNDSPNGENLVMQPGTYRIVYRPKNANQSTYTLEKTFKIESGTSVTFNY